jgi:uncharacterized membrane protein (UPF0127 family)
MQYIKFYLMTAILIACNSQTPANFSEIYENLLQTHLSSMNTGIMTHHASGTKFPVFLAITPEEQARGLSQLADKDFPDSFGMLFLNEEMAPRTFWMPDTYFDLDIIFLDESFKIVMIDKNVPHHPGRSETPPIYRTPSVEAMHILEVKAGSSLSKLIQNGDTVSWDKEIIPLRKLAESHRSQ